MISYLVLRLCTKFTLVRKFLNKCKCYSVIILIVDRCGHFLANSLFDYASPFLIFVNVASRTARLAWTSNLLCTA